MLTFPVSHWSSEPPQELTINNVNNLVLTSYTPFTDLDKTKPIIVTLTGNFYGGTTSGYGVNLGDLSTWNQVDVELASGGVIGGDGGNGGSGNSGNGGAGGGGLNINSANSSANVSFVNNGTIRGGGGGCAGGQRRGIGTHVSGTSGGKIPNPTCVNDTTVYASGGGGGGGRTHLTNSSGGARSSTTVGIQCTSFTNAGNGGSGTTSAPGGGGARGRTQYKVDNGSTCGACTNYYGIAGGGGGAYGTAGTNVTGGSPGAAGSSVVNRDHCAWTNNGTLTGPQVA